MCPSFVLKIKFSAAFQLHSWLSLQSSCQVFSASTKQFLTGKTEWLRPSFSFSNSEQSPCESLKNSRKSFPCCDFSSPRQGVQLFQSFSFSARLKTRNRKGFHLYFHTNSMGTMVSAGFKSQSREGFHLYFHTDSMGTMESMETRRAHL